MSDIDTNAITIDNLDSGASPAGETPPAASTPAAPAPAPTEDASGAAPATTDKAEPAEPEWFQKRLSTITRQRGNEARRADRAEARLADLERQLAELRKAPAPSAELRPQDFPNYDAFVAAQAEQKARAAAREELAAGLQSRSEQARAEAAQRQVEAFHAKAGPAAEAASIDLDAVMETLTQAPLLSQKVADYLFTETAHPAQLAEYLAENPAELDRISRLGPALAARALAKVEERFGAAKPAPNVTKAPPPGPTVGGRQIHRGNWQESNDMDDFAAGFMREQEERLKRA